MQFKIKPFNETICFIYGFDKNPRVYDFVLTLITKDNVTEAHALLSRAKLVIVDFLRLWKIVKEASQAEWFIFEVLPEHAKAYKMGLELESSTSKTFDGYDSVIIKLNRNAKLKHFNDTLV